MKSKKLRKWSMIAALIMTLVFAGSAFCVEWKTTNQATVAWDAVTTLDDGSAVPANNTVKYRVYLSNADSDPDKASPALLTAEPITALEYTLTLNAEGRYLVGVQAVRYDENSTEVGTSTINWSDTNGEATPNPFGLLHYLPPAAPANLR